VCSKTCLVGCSSARRLRFLFRMGTYSSPPPQAQMGQPSRQPEVGGVKQGPAATVAFNDIIWEGTTWDAFPSFLACFAPVRSHACSYATFSKITQSIFAALRLHSYAQLDSGDDDASSEGTITMHQCHGLRDDVGARKHMQDTSLHTAFLTGFENFDAFHVQHARFGSSVFSTYVHVCYFSQRS
jgi:hypothetical protein